MYLIQGLPLTPIISLVLLTAILQLVMGSASGVLGIISERFIPLYDLSAYNPGFVHRMVLMTPAFMPPRVGVLLTFYNVTGLTHEESYRDVMVSLNLGVALSLVLGYFLGCFSSRYIYSARGGAQPLAFFREKRQPFSIIPELFMIKLELNLDERRYTLWQL